MNEVSCRATMVCLEQLDRLGIPRAHLVAGLPVTLAQLQQPRGRLDWDTYVDVIERFAALVDERDPLESAGARATDARAFAFVRKIGRLATDPAWLYRFVVRFFGPAMFTCAETGFEELPDGRLRLTLEIPPTHRDCPAFFRISTGTFRALPLMAGYGEATVTTTISPRRAVYDVVVPDRERSLPRRAREWLARSLLMTDSVAVLHELQDELRGAYLGLQQANQRISQQKALLEQSLEEQRRAQEEKHHLEQQLHRAQKLEGLGLLAGGIAHDFNNLLTVIVANAELAVDAAPDGHAEQRAFLEAIREAGVRASALTAQLLAYAGRRPPSPRPLDLAALVSSVSNLLRPALPRHVTLVVHVSSEVPAVAGDGAQLQQVLMNLLGNAAESITRDRGTVTVRTGVTHVDAARRQRAHLALPGPAGPHATFEVQDDGAGISDEVLARIFDPFFSTKGEGRGLGLAAVVGTLRGHAGLLEVESRPGLGSLFRVLLPLGTPVAMTEDAPVPTTPWRGRGLVLVADDEDLVRQSVRALLERHGLDVLTAVDGLDAVEQVRRHGERLAAIILDYSMPRMTGDAAFRAIRALRPDAQVILSSGNLDEAVLDGLQGEGLAAVLRKPYRSAELAQALQRILGETPA